MGEIFPARSDRLREPTNILYSKYAYGVSFPKVQRQRGGVKQTATFTVEVKERVEL